MRNRLKDKGSWLSYVGQSGTSMPRGDPVAYFLSKALRLARCSHPDGPDGDEGARQSPFGPGSPRPERRETLRALGAGGEGTPGARAGGVRSDGARRVRPGPLARGPDGPGRTGRRVGRLVRLRRARRRGLRPPRAPGPVRRLGVRATARTAAPVGPRWRRGADGRRERGARARLGHARRGADPPPRGGRLCGRRVPRALGPSGWDLAPPAPCLPPRTPPPPPSAPPAPPP